MKYRNSMRRVFFFVIIAMAAVAAAFTTVRFRIVSHIYERGPTVWVVDGKPINVYRSYFEVQSGVLAFVVEWICASCPGDISKMTAQDALAQSRPTLWHAYTSDEVRQTKVSTLGGQLSTKRLVSVLRQQNGEQDSQNPPEHGLKYVLVIDNLNLLFDWTWIIDGKTYRIFGPGYYFDVDGEKLYFTIKWHAKALCEPLTGITDERAADLAMPLMKEIISRELFKFIPRIGIPSNRADLATHEIDFVGIELGCPDSACAGGVNCPAHGYRAARTPAQIAAAP